MRNSGGRYWVFFDVGDTLFHLKEEVYQHWADDISRQNGKLIGVQELIQAIRDEWENPARSGANLHQEWDDEVVFLESFYRAVLVRLGYSQAAIPGMSDKWDRIIATMAQDTMSPDSFDWREGMQELVEQLRENKVPMGIISNAFDSVLNLLERFHLRKAFNPVVLSYREGIAKPAPGIFEIALRRAKACAADAYFVDDRPAFRQAAARSGMHTLEPDAEQIKQKLFPDRNPHGNVQLDPECGASSGYTARAIST